VFDAFATTEMTQKRLEFFGPQSLNGLQRVGKTLPTAAAAVKGIHETVGFITSVDENTTLTVQDKGFVPLAMDCLFTLGKSR
jgi:hypothetical protein